MLDALAALAREKEADLVLLSGDLLDSARIFRETGWAFAQALAAIPCPVFLAPGNHDCLGPASPYAALEWPENVHIFTAGPGQAEPVDLPELNCTVWGWGFFGPRQAVSPLRGFRAESKPGRFKIGVLHGDVGGTGDYGPIDRADIAASGLDYLALGHVHQYSGLQREGETFWAYPGCPEGRGFDETGDKGVLYLEAGPGRVSARFIPMSRRRYFSLTVDVTGAADARQAILAALPERTQNDICRIQLTGEGAIPDLAALERDLSSRFYGLRLRDSTRLPRDLWARREEDSLTGQFLRIMWARSQSDPEDPVCQMAARFGLAALEGGEDAVL